MKQYDFASRLVDLRTDKGISQRALAKEINISQVAISQWENRENEPTMQSLIKLAQYFNVSVDYLVGLQE